LFQGQFKFAGLLIHNTRGHHKGTPRGPQGNDPVPLNAEKPVVAGHNLFGE
jgi:hypothetical protein